MDLAQDYELPVTDFDYRGLAKLKSTYADKLPLDIHPETGRIHTSYQAVSGYRAIVFIDPNLQNIPIRNAEGRRIRRFVAPANHVVLAADYSQIELRIMAHLSLVILGLPKPLLKTKISTERPPQKCLSSHPKMSLMNNGAVRSD